MHAAAEQVTASATLVCGARRALGRPAALDAGVAVRRTLLTQLLTDARELSASYRHPVSKRRVLGTDGFQLLVIHRLRTVARRFHVPLANHLLRRLSTAFYGAEIGNEVTLGDGVNFIHPMAIVIGGDAHIGARVRFMGSNTVGTAKDNGYPVIEDDVMIGAGARILGPVRVGRGAVIGANAVVLSDVSPGAVVTGVPGVEHLPSAERARDRTAS